MIMNLWLPPYSKSFSYFHSILLCASFFAWKKAKKPIEKEGKDQWCDYSNLRSLDNKWIFWTNAQWVEIIRNQRVYFIDINPFPMSSRERMSAAERAVRSKQIIERCEQMSEWRSKWPSNLRVDFIVLQPTVWCTCTSALGKLAIISAWMIAKSLNTFLAWQTEYFFHRIIKSDVLVYSISWQNIKIIFVWRHMRRRNDEKKDPKYSEFAAESKSALFVLLCVSWMNRPITSWTRRLMNNVEMK